LPHKAGKTAGCNLFAGLPHRFITQHAKICYALPTSQGQQLFLLSPEAYLLTEKKLNWRHVLRIERK